MSSIKIGACDRIRTYTVLLLRQPPPSNWATQALREADLNSRRTAYETIAGAWLPLQLHPAIIL